MSFEIPPGKERFFSDTKQKIESLIRKNILYGIKHYELQGWLNNFSCQRSLYLAAHLLDALIYRSPDMLKSMRRHMLEMQLATALQRSGYEVPVTVDDFLSRLKEGHHKLPIRFVSMDGGFDKTPGKSGAALLRNFREDGLINKSITIRPEKVATLPKYVEWLVLVDDFVGTGKQAEKFFKYYSVRQWAESRNVIFLSFMAHSVGVSKLTTDCSYVDFDCAEILSVSHGFFAPRPGGMMWGRDEYNSIKDVKDFYYNEVLLSKNVILSKTEFDLDLTVAFNRTIPNNTLAAYWTSKGQWCPLINRG